MISRVFHKSPGGKKIPISGLSRDFGSANLPPLMEISSFEGGSSRTETSHVTCFSESVEEQKPNNQELVGSWSSSYNATRTEPGNFGPNPLVQNIENFQYQDSMWMQDPSILKILIESNNDSVMRQNPKTESVEDQDYGLNSGGQYDFDCIWNY